MSGNCGRPGSDSGKRRESILGSSGSRYGAPEQVIRDRGQYSVADKMEELSRSH